MSRWSRRSFIAGAGVLAGAGGAGAATGAVPSDVPLLRTYVAGADSGVVRQVRSDMAPGTPLRLTREPENDYDARAVSVWTRGGRKLGYVPRIDNQALANLMDAGVAPRARVLSVRADVSRPDIRIDVSIPAPEPAST